MSNAISKSYNSIKELPSEVRSSFDERDQEKWMDAYNKASQTKEPEQAKVDAWMSMVDAPSSLAVETWGSVEVRDADGELVPVKTIEEYADKFIENGGLMHDSHSNVPVGTVWDYEVRKHPETGQDGIVFYFNIYRDGEVFERARDDILSGRKNAVSIGAEAPRGGYKCDDRGCYVERDVTDLYELSICETPANPEAYFINVGKDIAKSKQPMKGEVFRIGIQDYIVHQDYTTCPLQKCKHDLLEMGFKNVHLNKNGHIIAKSKKNEYRLLKAIQKMDYPFRYDLKKEQFEIMPDYGVEQAIEEALGNGWAHEDNIGHVTLTKEIPKEVFIDWYDRGFITKIGDFYCLKADDVAKDSVSKFMDEYLNLVDELNQAVMPVLGKYNIGYPDDGLFNQQFLDRMKNIFVDMDFDADELNGLKSSAKKKVKKDGDGGAMGVASAGASNPVYGSKPASLTNPDKKYGKKKKTKKEIQDDGSIHAVGSRQAKSIVKRYAIFTPDDVIDEYDGRPLVFDKKEDAEYVFESDDFPDGWYLTEVDENNKPFFGMSKSSPIAKKCAKGTWMDKKTGECIPIDEWKSKYGGKDKTKEEDKVKEPKEKPKEDAPKNEPKKEEPKEKPKKERQKRVSNKPVTHKHNADQIDFFKIVSNGGYYEKYVTELEKLVKPVEGVTDITMQDAYLADGVKYHKGEVFVSLRAKGKNLNPYSVYYDFCKKNDLTTSSDYNYRNWEEDDGETGARIEFWIKPDIVIPSMKIPKSKLKLKTKHPEYKGIKGKGKIDYEDDVVAVYVNGKMKYKGIEDYDGFKDLDWKYNSDLKRYEFFDGQDFYIQTKLTN